jgi:hypothetical protein
VFYVLTAINLPYGIIALLIAIITRYSEEGTKCSLIGQESRSLFLSLQIICLVLYMFTFVIHLVYLRIRGAEWCHE